MENKKLKMFKLKISEPDPVLAEITPIRVTQKSSNFDLNRDPFNAVDKRLRSSATIVGDEINPPWLKLDFQNQFIHKVVIYNRFYTNWFYLNNGCATTVEKFKECLRTHDKVNVTVYQDGVEKKSCGTLQLTYGLEQSDQIYTLVCNTRGDAVKFSKAEGEIRIWEIVVIGTGENL